MTPGVFRGIPLTRKKLPVGPNFGPKEMDYDVYWGDAKLGTLKYRMKRKGSTTRVASPYFELRLRMDWDTEELGKLFPNASAYNLTTWFTSLNWKGSAPVQGIFEELASQLNAVDQRNLQGVVSTLRKVFAEAIKNGESLEVQELALPELVGAPKVTPENEIVFSQELDNTIKTKYADQAIQCPNFELFLQLLEQITNENKLRPEIDGTKVAGLLNQLRVQKGLLPL